MMAGSAKLFKSGGKKIKKYSFPKVDSPDLVSFHVLMCTILLSCIMTFALALKS